MKREVTKKQILNFKEYLLDEEKSTATIEKYIRDVMAFLVWMHDAPYVDKAIVIANKKYLIENYQTSSVNSILSSLNTFFTFNEWYELRVKTIKIQRQIFLPKRRSLPVLNMKDC